MKINITLLGSANEYLSYPCQGTLDILEVGTDGSIIEATFQQENRPPVACRRPVFTFGTNGE